MSYDSNQPNKPHKMSDATKTATSVKNQPLGYINSRLNEANVEAPFSKVSTAAYVIKPNTNAQRRNEDYLGGKVTKRDIVNGKPDEVICYERYVCGYDTFGDMRSGDTAWIVSESCTTVYLRLTRLENALVWVHLPAHKVEEAGGDPYKVTWGYYPKQGRYLQVD